LQNGKGEKIMFEEIKTIVADNLGVDEDSITMETSFKEDLNADSLDLFEMVMALEENYGVEIPSEDLEQLLTVADVINYIENHK
jgi:acyl carrier protein